MATHWKHILLLAALLALLAAVPAYGAEGAEFALSELRYVASETAENDTTVRPRTVDGETWLFLPASADLERLTLLFDGEETVWAEGARGGRSIESGVPFSLTALAAPDGGGAYRLTLTAGDESASLSVLRSENLRALYLTSADPEKGREWVELDKDNKAKNGGAVLLRPDGSAVYDGKLKNIKGRGNSTWSYDKKPYQIKLKTAADLLETGESAEAEITWVLLANYLDPEMVRNSLTFELAAALGLPYSPHSAQIDLYYDGEYRGTYQLCEKTEISAGRVAIRNLEAEIEDLNPGVEDFDALPAAIGINESGASYQYVTGLTVPADETGGYLLELDYDGRAMQEKTWFRTDRGVCVVCKSPEYLDEAGVLYIRTLFQHFEDAVYNGGVDPDTGRPYTDFADLDSLVRCYLLLELSADNDAFLSSTFFYKPAGEEKLYAGPVWDFDNAYGTYYETDPGYVAGRRDYGLRLLKLPSFRERAAAVYAEELYPLVRDVVLSESPDARYGPLRSLAGCAAESEASRRMDEILWAASRAADEAPEAPELAEFLRARAAWLREEAEAWTGGAPPAAEMPADVSPEDWYYEAVAGALDLGLFARDVFFDPGSVMTRGMVAAVLHRMEGSPEALTGAPFTDVDPYIWYARAVSWAAEAGIVSGFDDGEFRADQPVTREQLAAILYRYVIWKNGGEAPAGKGDLTAFSDGGAVSPWAEEALRWAVDAGVISGMGDGTLAPRASALRSECASLMTRFCTIFDLGDEL